MKKLLYKVKIPLPQNSFFLGNIGDVLKNYYIYEIEEETILEKFIFDNLKDVKFLVKNGQYVEKGTQIFTQGFLGHKVYITNFSGIVDIGSNYYQLLGQKLSYKRKINVNGKIIKINLPYNVVISLNSYKIKPVFYRNLVIDFSKKIIIKKLIDLLEGNNISFLKFLDSTCLINDNITLLQLQKLIELGIKKLIVNAVHITDWPLFIALINRLDSFAVITGFGQHVDKKLNFIKDDNFDILWSKSNIYVCDSIEFLNENIVFEHPYWGINGEISNKDNMKVLVSKNQEVFEFYKKNIYKNK